MLDHHAFGQTGRAGGVDDVGQARSRQPRHLWIADGFVLQVGIVKADDGDFRHWQGLLH